jgi:phosphoketolase
MSTVEQARLHLMDKYWNAANYLTIGQIYLQENPLLSEPLRPEHIKPRLLGHWGTSPGLSFIYVHLNRLIQDHDIDMIYLAGQDTVALHCSPMCISKGHTQRCTQRSRRMPKEYATSFASSQRRAGCQVM